MIEQVLRTGPASSPGTAVLGWTAPKAAAPAPDALARLHHLAVQLASHPEALKLLSDIDAVAQELEEHRAVVDRLAFLERVAEVLACPEEIEAALGQVAALIVPRLADSCVIFLASEGGRPHAVALRHTERAGEALLAEAAWHFTPGSGRSRGASAIALETGEPVVLGDVAPSLFEVGLPETARARLRPITPCSAMALPLKARGRTLGVISLLMSCSGRHYGGPELEEARELAERLAIAADNAMLLREAEESRALLDTLIRSTPVGLALLDRELRYVRVNQALGELLGLAPSLAAGRSALADGSALGALLAARAPGLMRGDEPVVVAELSGRGAADRTAHWLITLYPVRTPAGKCLGVGVAVVDITARKEAELASQAAREAAEAASRAKGEFVAVVSHELRTPLTTVIGYADLLLTGVPGPFGERQREQLKRIKSSAWYLVGVIEEILTFARADAGKEQAQTELVDVAALGRAAADAVEPLALARGLDFRTRGLVGVRRVYTDGGKVRQILLNLLGNAVKFTDRGFVELELAEGAGVLELRVRDSGPGIPAADRESIFEPFRQLDQSATRQKGGTGLGLTVSRQLARLLGGEIVLESGPDAGSVFTLRLPALYPQSSASSWTAAVPSVA